MISGEEGGGAWPPQFNRILLLSAANPDKPDTVAMWLLQMKVLSRARRYNLHALGAFDNLTAPLLLYL